MKLKLPVTQRQSIDIAMVGDCVNLTIGDIDENSRAQTAVLDQAQVSDLIEMLKLCKQSRARRKAR